MPNWKISEFEELLRRTAFFKWIGRELKGATGLYIYKRVGGAGASSCMILNMIHIRDPFFQN